MLNKISEFFGGLIDLVFGQRAVLAEPGFDPTLEPRRQKTKRRGQWMWIAVIAGPVAVCAAVYSITRPKQALAPTPISTLPAPVVIVVTATPEPGLQITRETWTPDLTATAMTLTPTISPTPMPATPTGTPDLPIVRYINPPVPVISPSPTVDSSFNNLIGLFPTRTPFPPSMQTLMAILPTYTPYPTYTPFPTSTPRPPTAYPPQSTYTPLPSFTPIIPTQTPWVIYVTVEVTRLVEITVTPSETPLATETPTPTETPTETVTPP